MILQECINEFKKEQNLADNVYFLIGEGKLLRYKLTFAFMDPIIVSYAFVKEENGFLLKKYNISKTRFLSKTDRWIKKDVLLHLYDHNFKFMKDIVFNERFLYNKTHKAILDSAEFKLMEDNYELH